MYVDCSNAKIIHEFVSEMRTTLGVMSLKMCVCVRQLRVLWCVFVPLQFGPLYGKHF